MSGELAIDDELPVEQPGLVLVPTREPDPGPSPGIERVYPQLPRYLVRNPAAESRLTALVVNHPLVVVKALAGQGKRTTVAAWLQRNSAIDRSLWLRVSRGAERGQDLVRRVLRAVEISRCERADARSSLTGSLSPLMSAASRTVPLDRSTVVVIDLVAQPLTPLQVAGLTKMALERRRLRIVLIQDEDPFSEAVCDPGPVYLNSHDVRLSASSLREQFAHHGLVVPESIVRMLATRFRGGGAVAAALIEELTENPQRDPQGAVFWAHARVLLRAVRRLIPDAGLMLLSLLTLIPELNERILAAASSEQDIRMKLRVLVELGLLDQSESADAALCFRIPQSVHEIVRSMTLSYYIANRAHLHGLAATYFMKIGDPRSAIQQLMLLGDHAAALDLFCTCWDGYLGGHGIGQAQELCAQFSPSEIASSLEASSVASLLYLAVTGSVPVGLYETRVLNATSSDYAALSGRGKFTAIAARILLLSNRGHHQAAMAAAEDVFLRLRSDRHWARLEPGGAYLDFLLAAAHAFLCSGVLRRSAELYGEALELAETANVPIRAYQAMSGRAITLVLGGEYAVAQQLIDRARAREERLGMAESKTAAEVTLCQCVLWAYHDEYSRIATVMRKAKESHSSGWVWPFVGNFLDAWVLLREGELVRATSTLRTLLHSVLGPHGMPVFRQMAACLLGLALIASEQPGAALEMLLHEASPVNRTPFIAAVQSLAHTARGDPLAAIDAIGPFLEGGSENSVVDLVYLQLARALALEALELPASAERAFLSALGLATKIGIHLNLEILSGFPLATIALRARSRSPMLNSNALDLGGGAAFGNVGSPRRLQKLTSREREVLQRLVRRSTLAEIAADLFLSENTVKTHTRNIYRKLGVSSRREAADIAADWGAP